MNFIQLQFIRSRKNFGIAAVILAIIILLAVLGWYSNKKSNLVYAVFMTNNQVYFGNVEDWDEKYLDLKNVYYLQSLNSDQPQQVQVVKRGSELHIPTGDMLINREQVLFIEELSSNSPVLQNIKSTEDSK